jgi:hypothetical protein
VKKILLLSLAWLALTASIASAGGLKLAWNECLGAGGVSNRTFACNTNVGSNDLYVSFDPPQDIADVNGLNAHVDLLDESSAALPGWWQLKNAFSCRPFSLSAPDITGSCDSIWSAQRSPGIAAYVVNAVDPTRELNRALILGSVGVNPVDAVAVHPGTEYIAMVIRFDNRKTTGLGACNGCQDRICFVLSQVDIITNNNAGDITMRSCGGRTGDPCPCPGAPGTSVTWQGSETPTLNRTWGQVKTLYR